MSASYDSQLAVARTTPDNAQSLAARAEVLQGLRGSVKTLPPKLFYDARGAELFEAICELDEYYLTRTELSILRACVGEIATLTGPDAALVEYGSGEGRKVRMLLDALDRPAAYVPIDISVEQLAAVARKLAEEYPALAIHPVHADFTAPIRLPSLPTAARRAAFFPGSTIGNFHPAEAAAFLHRVRRTVGPSGAMILGVDRRKAAATLEAAYDDASGVTAAFNLNMLARLNREMDGTFDLARFRHRAVWNDEASRVEMHLESREEQSVRVAGERFHFFRGETILTECSYKYDGPRLEQLVGAAGFSIDHLWTDKDDRFWIAYLSVTTG
ncbi:MAG: L-histidine N(alpha)-methyltransferase [Gemmatimonadaceae bacterium]